MKIFLSHASQMKPVVKTIVKYLPPNVSTWLDENDLVWGSQLNTTFEQAIKGDADYVIVFVNELAGRSEWVQKEVAWALERERELRRVFLLPVFLRSEGDLAAQYFPQLMDRKNIQVYDYTDMGLKAAADQLVSGLFTLICDDISRIQNPDLGQQGQAINQAEEYLRDLASQVQQAVFPYREGNPITLEDLCAILRREGGAGMSAEDFEQQLNRIIQRNLIPGLYYDGFELYLQEEHSQWKSRIGHEQKVRIARKAATYIRSGMKLYIDAGSTTEELVRILCKRIEMKQLTRMTVATPSVNHADMISECCVNQGFNDEFSLVELYVPGGPVRSGTQAIVPFPGQERALADHLGGYDLAVIGANGISERAGLTTHANTELPGKRLAYENAKKRIIVCDDSKVGIELENKIADFSDELLLISNKNPVLEEMSARYPGKIILV